MLKADKTVSRETKYVAVVVFFLSLIMQIVFLIAGRWDYTVLLGNLLSAIVMIANFFLMGITIQKALKSDSDNTKKIMKASQGLRTLLIFIVIAIGVLLPVFDTLSVIIPVIFPRIAIALRPVWKVDKTKDVLEN